MRARHGNVANVPFSERRTLFRVLGIDLIRGRRDLHLLVQLLRVVQREREFVQPRVEAERMAREKEEATLSHFHLIVSNRKATESEAPCFVRFRLVHPSAATFKLYLGGFDWHAILVQNNARAIGRIVCVDSRRSENAERSQSRSE
jgi:hypothetical protein